MNRFILTIIFFILGLKISVSQQILNGGFENTNEFNSESFWYVAFGFNCFDPPYPVFAVIDNDSNNGINSAKLTSDYCYPEGLLLPGNIITGDFESNSPEFGYEYHERPDKLNFYYKYEPNVQGEVAFVKIMLFKFDYSNNEVTEVIGTGVSNITEEQSNYTLFSLPIEYFTESTPDYIHILFSTSDNFTYYEDKPFYNVNEDVANSYGTNLWVDDVSVSGGTLSLNEYLLNEKLKVYPNPIKSTFSIGKNEKIKSIRIFSVLGVLVFERKNKFIDIDISDLKNGIYYLEIETTNDKITKKIIKN